MTFNKDHIKFLLENVKIRQLINEQQWQRLFFRLQTFESVPISYILLKIGKNPFGAISTLPVEFLENFMEFLERQKGLKDPSFFGGIDGNQYDENQLLQMAQIAKWLGFSVYTTKNGFWRSRDYIAIDEVHTLSSFIRNFNKNLMSSKDSLSEDEFEIV